jgi:hypothetical protein
LVLEHGSGKKAGETKRESTRKFGIAGRVTAGARISLIDDESESEI